MVGDSDKSTENNEKKKHCHSLKTPGLETLTWHRMVPTKVRVQNNKRHTWTFKVVFLTLCFLQYNLPIRWSFCLTERTLKHWFFSKGQGSHSPITQLKWLWGCAQHLLAIPVNWLQACSPRQGSENGRLPISLISLKVPLLSGPKFF